MEESHFDLRDAIRDELQDRASQDPNFTEEVTEALIEKAIQWFISGHNTLYEYMDAIVSACIDHALSEEA